MSVESIVVSAQTRRLYEPVTNPPFCGGLSGRASRASGCGAQGDLVPRVRAPPLEYDMASWTGSNLCWMKSAFSGKSGTGRIPLPPLARSGVRRIPLPGETEKERLR